MKGRFRILKYGFRWQKKQYIENTIFACAILHNLLIRWDGLDEWEAGVNFQESAGEHETDFMARIMEEDPVNANLRGDYSMTSRQYENRRGSAARNTVATSREAGHTELWKKIIINFAKKYEKRLIQWPTRTQM